MNRPKKEFIPTSLSDLNIDAISIGSNSDRHNNNSNGARLNNFDRFKATSSSNLSYKHSNLTNHNSNNFGASRSSKLYGSQSNLSMRSSASSQNHYQPVVYNRNYNINSPKTPVASGDSMDKWLQAWEDTNNNNNNSYRAPSYHSNAPQQRQHSKVSQNSNNFNKSVVDSFDPFEDPWSGISRLYLLFFFIRLLSLSTHKLHIFSQLLS